MCDGILPLCAFFAPPSPGWALSSPPQSRGAHTSMPNYMVLSIVSTDELLPHLMHTIPNAPVLSSKTALTAPRSAQLCRGGGMDAAAYSLLRKQHISDDRSTRTGCWSSITQMSTCSSESLPLIFTHRVGQRAKSGILLGLLTGLDPYAKSLLNGPVLWNSRMEEYLVIPLRHPHGFGASDLGPKHFQRPSVVAAVHGQVLGSDFRPEQHCLLRLGGPARRDYSSLKGPTGALGIHPFAISGNDCCQVPRIRQAGAFMALVVKSSLVYQPVLWDVFPFIVH